MLYEVITFLTFLQRLMADAQRPVFLIVDGHSIHKARIINVITSYSIHYTKLYDIRSRSTILACAQMDLAHDR